MGGGGGGGGGQVSILDHWDVGSDVTSVDDGGGDWHGDGDVRLFSESCCRWNEC